MVSLIDGSTPTLTTDSWPQTGVPSTVTTDRQGEELKIPDVWVGDKLYRRYQGGWYRVVEYINISFSITLT